MTRKYPDYDAYAAALVPLAARLVGAVRYEGHAGSRAVFEQLRRIQPPAGVHPAEALAVILAAMVDEDRTPNELLAWVDAVTLTDHTIAEMTPREAHAARRLCTHHGALIPPALREIENAGRRRPTADTPVDASCGQLGATPTRHARHGAAAKPVALHLHDANARTTPPADPAQPPAAATTTEEVA